jgi:hypothetical protein
VDSKYNWSVKISTVTAIIHLKGLLIRKALALAARPICKKIRIILVKISNFIGAIF